MNNKYINNPWILALGIILIGLFFSLLLFLFEYIFKYSNNILNIIISIIAIYIIGYNYTIKTKEVMSKKLRKKTTLVYLLYNFIILVVFFLIILPELTFTDLIIGIILFPVLFVLTYFLTIWLLGFSGKHYLNILEKSKKPKHPTSNHSQTHHPN